MKTTIIVLNTLLLAGVSCGFTEKKNDKPTKYDVVVISGTIYNSGINEPMISYFDPIDMRLKPVEFLEYKVKKKEFKVKFSCSGITHLNVFLKNVWVQPGDSVHVDFGTPGHDKKFNDTLIFTGNNLGGYLVYPFFSPALVYKSKDFPDFNQPGYTKNELLFKNDVSHFFTNLSSMADSLLASVNSSEKLKTVIKNEMKFLEINTLLYPLTHKKWMPLNAAYLNNISILTFSENNIALKYYNLSLKTYHELLAKNKVNNTSSGKYYRKLFETALLFSGQERDYLLLNTVQQLDKIDTKKNDIAVKEINDSIVQLVSDKELLSKIKERLGISHNIATNDIQAEDLDGKILSFEQIVAQHYGKVVYIDFWASWCIPCRKEFPYGKELQNKFTKSLITVYFSIDENKDEWKNAVIKEQLPKENCFLLSKKEFETAGKRFGFIAVPHYLVFGKTGLLQLRNAPRPSDNESEQTVRSLL